jgi:hypothetical protein
MEEKRVGAVVIKKKLKNFQMLTDTTYHVWPRPGGKIATPRFINFTILVEAFPKMHHIKFEENWRSGLSRIS